MRRREFIGLVGSAAAWPLIALAQQPERMRRIGILIPQYKSAQGEAELAAFRGALHELGWTEGGTATFQIIWAGGDLNQIKSHAKELVAWGPDVILARTTPVTTALLQESRAIPIIFVNISDPVGAGFAASMSRPGGSATGFTNVEQSMGGKWVELLRETAPTVARGSPFYSIQEPRPKEGRLIQDAARITRVETMAMPIVNAASIEPAFDTLKSVENVGIVVQPDITTTANRTQILAMAAKHHLPAVYPFTFFTAEGGLAAYGIDVVDGYKRAATYVSRVLRGEKPGELPVQAPIKFELSVNLKTAKALGLRLPAMLLGRADVVIE
jgi:putative tryptophan/tyrosine transport system substrate-binding protein